MGQIPNVTQSNTQTPGSDNAYNKLDIDNFLKLMIAELQNQDPLNPLDNDKLVAQIGQIRSISATEKMTSTLDSVLLGQNISSATNLIGAEVDAISDDGQRITGLVDRVSVDKGVPKLHMDLNPQADTSSEKGNIEAGEYEYRVVWQDAGKLVGVDPLANEDGKKIKLTGDPQSVLISNLPKSTATKQVFRREAGEEDFHLVGALTDVNASTFLDTMATDDLSELVLSGTPELMKPERTFTVSLKNVGEIRPPKR